MLLLGLIFLSSYPKKTMMIMKKLFLSFTAMALLGFAACNSESSKDETAMDSTTATADGNIAANTTTTRTFDGTYTDLSTGRSVQVRRDEANGYMVDAATGQPIEFFVDMSTRDTFYGKTGTVVNNAILADHGTYKLDESKVKWEGDELKIKYADGSKEKVDGDEYKYKDGDSKMKVDGDEAKYKDENVKVKVEGDEVKVKQR
jgi:lipopolysaccharide export system protein LptA